MVVEILICEVMCFEICACISACMFICHETLTQHVLRNVFFVSRGGLFVQPQPDENHWVYHSTRRSCQAEASVFWHVVPAFHSPFIQNGMLAIVQILLHNTTIIKISLATQPQLSLDSTRTIQFRFKTTKPQFQIPLANPLYFRFNYHSLDSTCYPTILDYIVWILLATQPQFRFYWQPNHSLDSNTKPQSRLHLQLGSTIVQIQLPQIRFHLRPSNSLDSTVQIPSQPNLFHLPRYGTHALVESLSLHLRVAAGYSCHDR